MRGKLYIKGLKNLDDHPQVTHVTGLRPNLRVYFSTFTKITFLEKKTTRISLFYGLKWPKYVEDLTKLLFSSKL